ncbi:MAG: hypothetical protein E5V77_10495, partial [Mesorhizobium sp.]
KGGDRMSRRLSPIANVVERSEALELPISPLEGEMPGRAERGASSRPSQLSTRQTPLFCAIHHRTVCSPNARSGRGTPWSCGRSYAPCR